MNYYRLTICFLLLAFNSQAQDFVTFNEAGINQTKEDKLVSITLPFEIEEGYHIQSEDKTLDGSLPTEITFQDNDLYEIISYKYSKKINEKVVLDHYEHNVLINKFEITVTLRLKDKASNSKLKGELFYQACTDRQCLFPRTLDFQISL